MAVAPPQSVGSPSGHVTPSKAGVPGWVCGLAALISLLKAIPLGFVALAGGTLATEGGGWAGLGFILLAVIAIPLLIVLVQLGGAITSSRTTLVVSSALLTAIDGLFLLGSLSEFGSQEMLVGFGLMLAVTCAQASVLIGSITAKS